jgi:hypothetical protein
MELAGQLWPGDGKFVMRIPILAAVAAFSLVLARPTEIASETRAPIFTADRDACFGRTYDRAYLASHPRQKVTGIHILRSLAERKEAENWRPNAREESISQFRQDGGTTVSAFVTFRDRRGTFHNSLICDKEGRDGIHCAVECDGGSFRLQRQTANTVLLNNSGFVLLGGCGEEVEEGKRVFFSPGADDKLFRLENKPLAACFAEQQKAEPIAAGKPLRERFREDEAFCFGSDYDATHLTSHPRQMVTSLRVGRLEPAREKSDDPAQQWWWFNVKLDVALTVRNGGISSTARYSCSPEVASWVCRRESVSETHNACSDRNIQIVRGEGDDILVYNRNSGLPIDKECETAPDSGQFPQNPLTRTDDKVFRLARMPVAACRR